MPNYPEMPRSVYAFSNLGITLQTNRDFNQLILHLWSKFGNESSGQQTQNLAKFDFEVKFDLAGHGQSSTKAIGTNQ